MEIINVERREEIDRLLRVALNISGDTAGAASVYALLEVADAIDRLAAEVEKLSWSREPSA